MSVKILDLHEDRRTYAFPEVISGVNENLDDIANDSLEIGEGDLALITHLAKYFNRKIATVLRERMIALKREYDEEGGVDIPKTPFALRNITDSLEREIVLGNISAFATTHGCTGGCAWCCYDALPVRPDLLEVVPLAQKKHFFSELKRVSESVDPSPEFLEAMIRASSVYMDTDPFDDPDIVELMAHVYKDFAATPFLSTVVPKKGLQNFKYLTHLAYRYDHLRKLKAFSQKIEKVKENLISLGLNNIRELQLLSKSELHLTVLNSLVLTLRNIQILDDEIKKTVIDANQERYNRALEFFHLGEVNDLYDFTETDIKELAEFVLTTQEGLGKYQEFQNFLTKLDLDYSDVLHSFGLGMVQDFEFTNELKLSELAEAIEKEEKFLGDKPDIGCIRVSLVEHRERVVEELANDGRYLFYYNGRGAVAMDPEDNIRLAGKGFYGSDKTDGGYGIACNNSMKLTPFGLFNVAAGRISDDFPQGRLIVPYEGLVSEGNELAEEGQNLAVILKNTIAVFTKTFKAFAVPEEIFVYDGSHRVRKIVFDHKTFRIVSDEVVMENVMSLAELKGLKKNWILDVAA